MMAIVQTSITRENLRKGRYIPEKVTLLGESPLDGEARRRHYRPAVELLHKIHETGGCTHG